MIVTQRRAEKASSGSGGTNRPWVPVAGLGILGIAPLVSAAARGQQEAEASQPRVSDEQRAALNKRLETIAWGCFLVMLGGFAFVPRVCHPTTGIAPWQDGKEVNA